MLLFVSFEDNVLLFSSLFRRQCSFVQFFVSKTMFFLEMGEENDSTRDMRQSKNSLSLLLRKVSGLSLRNNCSIKSTIPISPTTKFKLIIKSTKPEVTVAFLLADMPDFALSSRRNDDMHAEKITNDVKFCKLPIKFFYKNKEVCNLVSGLLACERG